jgi:hypothetical protein
METSNYTLYGVTQTNDTIIRQAPSTVKMIVYKKLGFIIPCMENEYIKYRFEYKMNIDGFQVVYFNNDQITFPIKSMLNKTLGIKYQDANGKIRNKRVKVIKATPFFKKLLKEGIVANWRISKLTWQEQDWNNL